MESTAAKDISQAVDQEDAQLIKENGGNEGGPGPQLSTDNVCQEPKLADTEETGFVGPFASAVGGGCSLERRGRKGQPSEVGPSGSAEMDSEHILLCRNEPKTLRTQKTGDPTRIRSPSSVSFSEKQVHVLTSLSFYLPQVTFFGMPIQSQSFTNHA